MQNFDTDLFTRSMFDSDISLKKQAIICCKNDFI